MFQDLVPTRLSPKRVFLLSFFLMFSLVFSCTSPAPQGGTQLCRADRDCGTDQRCAQNVCQSILFLKREAPQNLDASVEKTPDQENTPEQREPSPEIAPEPQKELPPGERCEKPKECGPCQKDSDCANEYICLQGQCKKGCRDDKNCPVGYCDPSNLTCQQCLENQHCPKGKLCTTQMCQEGPDCRTKVCTGCTQDKDCVATELCLAGLCKTANCREDKDCKGGKLCKQNICAACTDDKECPKDTLCDLKQGACIPGNCFKHSDCPTGLLCKQNSCSKCTADTECEQGFLCLNDACTKADCRLASDCSNGQVCLKNNCAACTQNAECGAGKVCVLGICKPGDCLTIGDCPLGKVCKTNKCSDCADKLECGTGKVCDNGVCKTGDCVLRSECLTGKICKNNVCSACASKTECSTGEVCDNGICKTGDCVNTGDCPLGKLCKTNKCSDCTNKAECGSGKVCANGSCKTGNCNSSSDCNVNEVCIGNKCGPCNSDGDCPISGSSCRSGRCWIPTSTQNGVSEWADGTQAQDCASYQFPSAGYIGATRSGVYKIKPTGQPQAFSVHCDLDYAGGGWTLAMKIDGNKSTFRYDVPYWTNQSTYAPQDADFDNKEAKLASFHSLPVQEIMIGMKGTTSAPMRTLILRKNVASLHALFTSGNNIGFTGTGDTLAGRTIWRGLVEESSLQSSCGREGFNLDFGTGGTIHRVRIGYVTNQENNCNTPDSFIGVGNAGTLTTAGNYASTDQPDNGTKDVKTFTYIYIRKLNSTMTATTDNGALKRQDGVVEESCLGYRMPPTASITSGVYWLQPKGQTTPFKAQCEQVYQGGGWTLTMKIDGSKTTFRYPASHWTSKTPHNPGSPEFNSLEAKLLSYSTLPLKEIYMRFRTPVSSSGGLRSVLLHKQGSSLYDIINGGTSTFDYPLGRRLWQNAAEASLQTNCTREGFNVSNNSSDYYARTRIGIIGDESGDCKSADSRIGVGGMGKSCAQNDNISAGSSSHCSPDGGSKDQSSFVYLFIR